jgi:hypothetical protein
MNQGLTTFVILKACAHGETPMTGLPNPDLILAPTPKRLGCARRGVLRLGRWLEPVVLDLANSGEQC